MFDGILVGFQTAASPVNLLTVALGCVVGIFFAMLPGFGAISALALMIPIAYGLDPATGLILMAGVYCGATFAHTTSSVLSGAPGSTRQALATAATSSFAGGTIAAVLLLVAAPSLAGVSLDLQPSDHLAFMVLALIAVAAFAGRGRVVKALLTTVLGLMLATVGTDPAQGSERFTFGSLDLIDGIPLLVFAMAAFVLSEALMAVLRPTSGSDRKGEAFGGSARNAACVGSFLPLLALGIPVSGAAAVMLGALMSYGIEPGPRLFIDDPAVFWSVILSICIGQVVLLVLNLPLAPWIARILAVPPAILIPMILLFALIGVYFVTFKTFDMHLMVILAVAAVGLRLLDFPMAPMLLGFILGGMMEENLQRALIINNDSWSFLWERTLTLSILVIAALILFVPMVAPRMSELLRRCRLRAGEGG